MSNDKSSDEQDRRRRCSLAPLPITSIFAKANGPPYPSSITTTAVQDQLQRISVSSFCPPGTPPSKTSLYQFGDRRGSASSMGSGAIDENAFDEDDSARSIPNTPFVRRMSLGAQAVRNVRRGSSTSTIGDGCGNFSLSNQFRARAESSVTQSQRPYFSGSPTFARKSSGIAPMQADITTPQTIVDSPAPTRSRPKEPDAFQERILKGDFYID